MDNDPLFQHADFIHTYARADAIWDGTLIPIPDATLADTGIKYPTAITINLWAELSPTPSEISLGQSFDGRLHDLLMLFLVSAKRCKGDRMRFKMIIARDRCDEEIEVLWSSPDT